MTESPVDIQLEAREEWLQLDALATKAGVEGGLPYGVLEYPIETRNKKLRLLVDFVLGVVEQAGQETWRSKQQKEQPEVSSDWVLVNSWMSRGSMRKDSGQVKVAVYKNKKTGRATVRGQLVLPEIERLSFLIDTYDVRWKSSFAAAELVAQEKLHSILTPTQQIGYLMNDCFIQLGGQSGNTYLVRKNRPTLAFGAERQPLCALCLHPLAYYTNTWAGVLVPSDEVLVHLKYIQTAEFLFWRRANQIPLRFVQSGV